MGHASRVTGSDIDELRAQLRAEMSGPDGFFETAVEDVLGEQMEVFKNRSRSLREWVADARKFGDAEFLVLGDQRITFTQFVDQVASVSAALRDRYGVGHGNRVAILAANCPEWIVAYFAAVSLGAIGTAFNGWWTPDEIAHGLELTEPAVLIADHRRLERVGRPGLAVVEIETGFADLVSHAPGVDLPDVPIDEDDAALIQFTSGTTGRPKAPLVSHRGLIGFMQAMMCGGAERMMLQAKLGQSMPPRPAQQNVTLGTSPLFHVSGLHGMTLSSLLFGGKIVFRRGAFDAVDVLRMIQDERITTWTAMGSMGPRVLSSGRLHDFDTSSLINMGFGGAPLAPDLQMRLRDAFPNASPAFGMGYGSSESVAVPTNIGGKDFIERATSCGRVNITFQVEIRDADAAPCAEGVEGEIHVRSPYTMLGYFRNPEATAAAIKPGRWLAMGDVGRFEDGWLYINSRARDMILRAAENIYPVEIEHRLDSHPGVHESAVIGVDHDELGQEVKAVVVPEAGVSLDPDELAAWCAETLAAYKVPSLWEIRREPLPRNAAGKIVKGAITGEHDAGLLEE